MSTFLELCQDARIECEIAGSGPATVLGQSGQLARVIMYVKDAWTEVQNSKETWRWMRHGFTLNTTAADGKYAPSDCVDDETTQNISRFRSWRLHDPEDPPRIYLTSSGISAQFWMTYFTYHQWRQVYEIAQQVDAQPAHIAVDPLNNIRFGPAPDADYTLKGDYYLSAQILAADDDTPEMPTQFHKLIVYGAMVKWGYYMSDDALIRRATIDYKRMKGDLEQDQLPMMGYGPPLA